MEALILAAGYATRLYPLTKNKAKPLLPVKGHPIINYIVKSIEPVNDINNIYVVTNQKFYQDFYQWEENHKFSKDIEIINDTTVQDESKLGAIGDINYVIKKKKIEDDLLVIAGDNLFNFNLKKFISQAKDKKPAVSLGVYDVKEKDLASLYGIVNLDDKNKIVDFQEKPKFPKTTLAAVGLYFFPKQILKEISRYLDEGGTCDEPGYFITWLCENDQVYAISLPGDWFDIGNVESYHRANAIWQELNEGTT